MKRETVLKGLEILTIGLAGALVITAMAHKITGSMELATLGATLGVMTTGTFITGLAVAK